MRGSGIIGWLAGALGAVVIVALASVLAPAPQQTVGPPPKADAELPADQSAAPAVADGAAPGVPAPDSAPDSAPGDKADPSAAPAVSPGDTAPKPGTEPAPRVSAEQAAAPSAPAAADLPIATASDAAPGTGPAPLAQTAGAAEPAPDAAAATAPELPALQTAPPEPPQGVAAGTDQPLSPATAPDAAPRVAGAVVAPPPPASDAAPTAGAAPQHDTLLEPALIPAAAPDAGTAPGIAATPPAAPAAATDRQAALPPVSAPSPSDAPDTAPNPGMTATIQDDKPSTLPSVGRLTDRDAAPAPGVMEAGLPQIGMADPGADALPQIGKADAVPGVPAQGPLQLYARAFIPASPPKPLFVILLRDIGETGMKRDELLRLPFPVTIVQDPLAPDANAVMQAWRGAGQEVVMAMGGLPEGAEASDVAQTFQALSTSLPQAVAVIDANGATFQNDRPLASLVVPEVQAAGMGLVTFDEGLDAADQIARRSGVPSAQVFRRLDGKGEGKDVIRRYLDRAAFKAAQDGAVVVLGDTSADTVAAILEWTVEGKAAGVTLAPLTAVLGR